MKLVFILAMYVIEICLIYFLQIMEIIRALGINTFMDYKVFALFFLH